MKVIPAINCMDLACVSHRLLVASKFLSQSDWIHLDVADARFTYNKTWSEASSLVGLFRKHPELKFKMEVHLMVEEPEKRIKNWLEVGFKRAIIHLETLVHYPYREEKADPKILIAKIFKACAEPGAEVMLSSNPETKLEDFKDYLDYFGQFQVLAVKPGLAGQKFLPVALEKVKFLRAQFPNAIIEVDGGINLETAKLAKEAGADVLVAASYIFDASDPKEAYKELVRL